MNQHYNYPHKELWEDAAWEKRKSCLVPLTRWIGEWNLEHNRIPGKPEGERPTGGDYDRKSHALTDPKVRDYWKGRGLYYHCTSMGLPWIAMVPTGHLGKKGYGDEMDTLLVLTNADNTDPSWCMYTLERNRAYLEAAAEQGFALLFVSSDKLDTANAYISIFQEAIILFHLNYNRLYLDVSAVEAAGKRLREIPGFAYLDRRGAPVADPDGEVKRIGGIPALDIAGRWTNKTSLTQHLINSHGTSNQAFDREALIHSEIGRKMAEGIYLEYIYDDAEDPDLQAHWEQMGLRVEFHDRDGEQWVSALPLGAWDHPERKLPCMCVLQEVNRFDPHQAVTAFSYCYEYMRLVAQGELMVIFFAMEALDDNDLLHEILEDATGLYPLDRSRVYITGHSHNGRFSAEYMRRHPRDIAALATLGNEPGQLPPRTTSGFFVVTDEQLDIQASVDMPTINVSGFNERNSMFPLHSDPPHVRPGQWVALNTAALRVESWQRRLWSARCPQKTVEEIAATRDSEDYVIRRLGIPADRTECLYLDGSENYIADIKNVDGKYHLRIVALGNMPHTVTPAMINLTWSWVRRFARDQETGACIELY